MRFSQPAIYYRTPRLIAARADRVCGKLGHHNGDPSHVNLIEALLPCNSGRLPPRLGNLTFVVDGHGDQHDFQRAMVTLAPPPGFDSMQNSFVNRRAPPSPRPKPGPVVKPSFSAASMSRMPGPRSSKASRTRQEPRILVSSRPQRNLNLMSCNSAISCRPARSSKATKSTALQMGHQSSRTSHLIKKLYECTSEACVSNEILQKARLQHKERSC